jgi:hypothetical protein
MVYDRKRFNGSSSFVRQKINFSGRGPGGVIFLSFGLAARARGGMVFGLSIRINTLGGGWSAGAGSGIEVFAGEGRGRPFFPEQKVKLDKGRARRGGAAHPGFRSLYF